jgi:hypothetical protein
MVNENLKMCFSIRNNMPNVTLGFLMLQITPMGLDQPLDGVTNPKYKLLQLLTTKKSFAKRRRH